MHKVYSSCENGLFTLHEGIRMQLNKATMQIYCVVICSEEAACSKCAIKEGFRKSRYMHKICVYTPVYNHIYNIIICVHR